MFNVFFYVLSKKLLQPKELLYFEFCGGWFIANRLLSRRRLVTVFFIIIRFFCLTVNLYGGLTQLSLAYANPSNMRREDGLQLSLGGVAPGGQKLTRIRG